MLLKVPIIKKTSILAQKDKVLRAHDSQQIVAARARCSHSAQAARRFTFGAVDVPAMLSTLNVQCFGQHVDITNLQPQHLGDAKAPTLAGNHNQKRAPSAPMMDVSGIDPRNYVRSSVLESVSAIHLLFPALTPSQGLRPSQRLHSAAFVKIAESRLRKSIRAHQLKPSRSIVVSTPLRLTVTVCGSALLLSHISMSRFRAFAEEHIAEGR